MVGRVEFTGIHPSIKLYMDDLSWYNEFTDNVDDDDDAARKYCAAYEKLIACGMKPEAARSVLPTATATKLYITGTNEQLRQMLKLRMAKNAQPQVRALLAPLAEYLKGDKDE